MSAKNFDKYPALETEVETLREEVMGLREKYRKLGQDYREAIKGATNLYIRERAAKEAAERRCAELAKDAARYRWLRANERRDHKHHTKQSMHIAIEDWGSNLGETRPGSAGGWCQQEIYEGVLDDYIDAAIAKGPQS